MKSTLSYAVAIIIFFSSLPASSQPQTRVKSCENGECVAKNIAELNELGVIYKKQCLPENIKDSDIKKYHQEHGLSEECWARIRRIKHLEDELQKHRSVLESKVGCENGNCKQPSDDVAKQITELSKANETLSCSPEKKQQIKNSCTEDLACVLMGTATLAGGYLADKLYPAAVKPKNCHLGDDNCVTQLATSFMKAAFTFFKGSWELLKKAGNAVGGKVRDFWSNVTQAEDHSSTSQLALARASEDNNFFHQLKDDFPGTMKKVWATFVASITEWLKTSAFCQKWSGTPHFSQCLRPTETFDCIPCKNMVTGICSVSGTLAAEIIPAFIAGGLLTAAKHGISGAAKIAKLYKVSDNGIDAVKQSRLSKLAVEASDNTSNTSRLAKTVEASQRAAVTALSAINNYLLTPTRKALKASYTAIDDLLKSGGSSIAVTPAGKVLIFAGTSLSKSLKVVLYPIDNPLTAMANKAGAQTFERTIALGKPKIAVKTATSASILAHQPQLEPILAKLDEAVLSEKISNAQRLQLEKEFLEKVSPFRKEAAKNSLSSENVDLNEIISRLYPELKYGDLAKSLPAEKVLEAEKELTQVIAEISDSKQRDALLEKLQAHVGNGVARSNVVGTRNADDYDPNSRWPSALRKILSPTLKSNAQQGKEDKESK